MVSEAKGSRTARILLVEDESMVALLVEDMLLDLGFEVVAVASRLETGLAAARELEFDVAVLDVNLGGASRSFSIAEVLQSRRIPFLFATGYGRAGLNGAYPKAGVIQKPFQATQLRDVLTEALGGQKGRIDFADRESQP